jgi:hypothetical protein
MAVGVQSFGSVCVTQSGLDCLHRLQNSGHGEVFHLERARIGRSGVGLGRVVSDLLEREGFEFGGELA